MVLCKYCESELLSGSDYVVCNGCSNSYCFGCSLKENTYQSMSKGKKLSWRCQYICKGHNNTISFVNETPIVKRKRGRPRKSVPKEEIKTENVEKRKVGRPRKYPAKIIQGDKEFENGEDVQCCALACTNMSNMYQMTKLPVDPKLRQRWIKRIGRVDWTPTDNCALCEIHFRKKLWVMNRNGRKWLKPNSAPSLFLRGENIKSWVTMDKTGQVHFEGHFNGIDEEHTDDVNMDDSELYIKSEALEPEIDMIEGGENIDTNNCGEEPFETVFCNPDFQKPYIHNIIKPPVTVQSQYSMETECILPDLICPSAKDLACDEEDTEKQIDLVEGSELPTITGVTGSVKFIERPYACPVCSRRLARQRTLGLHLEKLHPDAEETKIYLEEKKRRVQNRPPKPVTTTVPPETCSANVPVNTTTILSNSSFKTPVAATNASLPVGLPIAEMQPFLLLVQPQTTPETPQNSSVTSPPNNALPLICPPTLPSFPPHLAELTMTAWDTSDMFCVVLTHLPLDTRTALKRKLMDLVETVTKRNIHPKRIIIAYSDGAKQDQNSVNLEP